MFGWVGGGGARVCGIFLVRSTVVGCWGVVGWRASLGAVTLAVFGGRWI